MGPRGGVVTQRSAKPFTPVQFWSWPPLQPSDISIKYFVSICSRRAFATALLPIRFLAPRNGCPESIIHRLGAAGSRAGGDEPAPKSMSIETAHRFTPVGFHHR